MSDCHTRPEGDCAYREISPLHSVVPLHSDVPLLLFIYVVYKKMFFDSIVIERKRKYRPILGRRKWKGQEKGKDTSRIENWV